MIHGCMGGDYVEGRVLGEGAMVVLGGEGDAWREVEEDRGLRCVRLYGGEGGDVTRSAAVA